MQREDNGSGLLLLSVLTASRLAFAATIAVLTLWSENREWAMLLSAILIVVIEGTDLLDGYLARSRGLVTPFGKMFDPYADSVSRLTVYWSLAVVGRAWTVVPLIMAVRDVTVSYARIIMTRKGIDVSARWTGKAKAWVQGTGGIVLMSGPLWWGGAGRWVIPAYSIAVILATLGSMCHYVYDAGLPQATQSGE